MRKPSREIRDLYQAYMKKKLRPEFALEFASDFALDLINAFGEKLELGAQPQKDWVSFIPYKFILQLNNLLSKYKEVGRNGLDNVESALLVDNQVFMATLLQTGVKAAADSFPDEEHFQLPSEVVEDLNQLTGGG